MHVIIDQLINGLMLSCTYALIGVGFSLFFGALNVIHFAHGDVCIAGAFLTLAVHGILVKLGITQVLSPWEITAITLILGVLATSFFGVLVERVAIRPFRKAPILIVLVATVAMGIIIREGIKNFYPTGANPQSFPKMLPEKIIQVAGIRLSYENILIFLFTIVLIGALFLFIKKTRLGLAIRAISQSGDVALMMGINLNKTVVATFFIGSALGAVAGIMNGLYFGGTRFDLGLLFGVKGFSVAVVGGLGNVYGAVMGGLVFGLMETFAMAFIPQGTSWKEFIAFSIVVLFLIFRPRGIVGERVVEKV
ncbi:MAG: branched-chain amino acid ABC transporter permease [Deltaproteobacteria bacterium]|nr:branched-chain amino acid ABC transporter permease [Deltaproteobacteria bacterium]MBW2122576.1 branched-chain amino acid ABC transporter permease [Deltaproteobacteria bacterium]